MSVYQKDASLKEPISSEVPATIATQYIKPTLCESVINLQMDYISNRRSNLNKYLFGNKITLNLLISLISIGFYWKLGVYLSEYNISRGVFKLFKNSYFINDLINCTAMVFFIVSLTFGTLYYMTCFLSDEAHGVPDNLVDYFGIDLKEYSTTTTKTQNKKKLSDVEKKMKDNSLVIEYRDTPIAFIAKSDTIAVSNNKLSFKILGFAIRRVYIKSEILDELLAWCKNKMIEESKEKFEICCIIEIYSFESFDEEIIKKSGFKCIKEDKINGVVNKLFNITKKTYELVYNPELNK
ncbi:hypothetical protein CANARDRAFT_20385 [[Candida] arabinofermentans NRRL YB-2248]|uniref:Uncharacterized protein n=1 Tax=[Candida] arabinofermentans NRRL YB-2248 TaxID=983967 RepID=A0A1E4T7B5_9ASCO|nr:hypothetical protein CANARDRAFT_20385 [[Candida] arabinofermentans NRRL YB-2248]